MGRVHEWAPFIRIGITTLLFFFSYLIILWKFTCFLSRRFEQSKFSLFHQLLFSKNHYLTQTHIYFSLYFINLKMQFVEPTCNSLIFVSDKLIFNPTLTHSSMSSSSLSFNWLHIFLVSYVFNKGESKKFIFETFFRFLYKCGPMR